jgi:hypothetical protein
MHGALRRMYIILNVEEDKCMRPQLKKEISLILWHDLNSVTKDRLYHNVNSFYSQLMKWIRDYNATKQKASDNIRSNSLDELNVDRN